MLKLIQLQEGVGQVGEGIVVRDYVKCLYGVRKWDGNSYFASDMCGAHVIFSRNSLYKALSLQFSGISIPAYVVSIPSPPGAKNTFI